MPELPMDLRKLEPLRGALEMIRYLDDVPDGFADMDDICDDLDMSDRRFRKVVRRLVTNGYIQMRSDYVYELTTKGEDAAEVLHDYYDEAEAAEAERGIVRDVYLAVPRNLVKGETSPLIIGLPEHAGFPDNTTVVLRMDSTHATIGDFDEMMQIGSDAFVLETTVTPQNHDKARLRLQVFQLKHGGDDLAEAGGMYVDMTVLPSGDTGDMYAYSAELEFED